MKEHPIICTGESVRSILDGTKTQTRRLIKGVPDWCTSGGWTCFTPPRHASFRGTYNGEPSEKFIKQPYCVGDVLWVRETWADLTADHPSAVGGVKPKDGDRIVYQADPADYYQWWRIKTGDFYTRSPIHMPRWASRITLEVLSVRTQRLQDISDVDAVDEGIRAGDGNWHTGDDGVKYLADRYGWYYGSNGARHNRPTHAFASAWDAINGKRASWDSNPWIWAIEFKRLAEHTTHKET